jgi:hypothetical protein
MRDYARHTAYYLAFRQAKWKTTRMKQLTKAPAFGALTAATETAIDDHQTAHVKRRFNLSKARQCRRGWRKYPARVLRRKKTVATKSSCTFMRDRRRFVDAYGIGVLVIPASTS